VTEVPLLDLRRQYQAIKVEIDSAIAGCLEHTRFILGPEVETFERNIAAYCGTSFAVGVASGTDALLLSLRAFDVGHGDEVITSSFSFFASAANKCLTMELTGGFEPPVGVMHYPGPQPLGDVAYLL